MHSIWEYSKIPALIFHTEFSRCSLDCYEYSYDNRQLTIDSIKRNGLSDYQRVMISVWGDDYNKKYIDGFSYDDVINTNSAYWVSPENLVKLYGSANEVLSLVDKSFDGYWLVSSLGAFQDDEYYEEVDITSESYLNAKRIMQQAAKDLDVFCKETNNYMRIDWSDVKNIFNNEFIEYWLENTVDLWAYSEQDSFNLGRNEIATILNWQWAK